MVSPSTLQLTGTATPSVAAQQSAATHIAQNHSTNPKQAMVRSKNKQARSRYNANKARLKRKGLQTKLAALAAPKVISTPKSKPIAQTILLVPKTKITVQHTVQVWRIGTNSYVQQLVTLQCYAQSLTTVGTLVCYVPKTRANPIAQHILVSYTTTGLQHSYVAVQNTTKTYRQLSNALAYLSNPKAAIAASKAKRLRLAAATPTPTPKTASALKAAATRANNKAKAAAIALHNKRYALLNNRIP